MVSNGAASVLKPVTGPGVMTVPMSGGDLFATRNLKPFNLPKNMLNNVELDQRRADFLENLYQERGRNDQLFTGIWNEFKQCLATNFRDLDYEVVRNDIIRSTHSIDSSVAERNADIAITVLIRHLTEGWKQS